MKLNKADAELFIPDGKPTEEALERTTHMAIAAHHDDIERFKNDVSSKITKFSTGV